MEKEALRSASLFWAVKAQSSMDNRNKALALVFYQKAKETSEQVVALEEDKMNKTLLQANIKLYADGIRKCKAFDGLLAPGEVAVLADALFEQGMNFDEKELYLRAVPVYKEACKHYLDIFKQSNKDKYRSRAIKILDRLEKLKPLIEKMKTEDSTAGLPIIKETEQVKDEEPPPPNTTTSVPEPVPVETSLVPKPKPKPKGKPTVLDAFSAIPLTDEDKQTIRTGSRINKKKYSVYREGEDLSRYFNLKSKNKWTDPDGMLQLDPQQDKDFARWVRASDYFSLEGKDPVMIRGVSAGFIKQSKVGDCSFISSLCVAANYESRFKKQLITSIIFPKDDNGIPVFNPQGKYMVKLWFNGAFRKVFVDDFLPTSKKGTVLCSQSTRNELWVSIIEKAYVKVNGGYDFPGSNGGIDQFALTNWIPQTHRHNKMDREQVWKEMHEGIRRGSCLITAGTYQMNAEQEQRFGLASAHAYAVLNTAEVKGLRLLQLKNPWSKFSYRGKYSIYDQKNMTIELRRALQYGMEEDEYLDGGVFWIDYHSFCELYEQTDINWDPKSLPNRIRIHRKWVAYGPTDDSIMLLHNPQYRLTLKVKGQYGLVWLLLSRHYFKKNQILSSKERDALSVMVYDHTGGDLVLTPQVEPVSKVPYTNYPHILVRLTVPGGVKHYSCVVSAIKNDPRVATNYTFSVLATENISPSLSQIPRFWPNVKRVKGNWSEMTAGGRMEKIRSYRINPMFTIKLAKEARLRCRLSTQRQLGCNVALFRGYSRDQVAVDRLEADSGVYLPGFAFCQADELYPGTYIVVPSTYEKKQFGAIILEIECTQGFEVAVLH